MNLKKKLLSLVDLLDEEGSSRAASLLAWLEFDVSRRTCLLDLGLSWSDDDSRKIAAEGCGVSFRVRCGESQWQRVQLLDVIGHMLKVGLPGGRMSIVGVEAVHPDDIGSVKLRISSHPGSAVQLVFDDDESVFRCDDGMKVVPVSLSHPDSQEVDREV